MTQNSKFFSAKYFTLIFTLIFDLVNFILLLFSVLENIAGPGGPTKKCFASMAKHFLLRDVGD